MKLQWRLVLTFLAVRAGLGEEVINLKTFEVTRGVKVNYGRFKEHGEYKMFWGIESIIQKVDYGDVNLFPGPYLHDVLKGLFVEYLRLGEIKIVVFNEIYMSDEMKTELNRSYFELKERGFEQVPKKRFMELINLPILVSLDIDSNFKHPFVSETYEQGEDIQKYRFEMYKTFSGLSLMYSSLPIYMIGNVYFKNVPIVFGVTKIDHFASKCIYVEYIKTKEETKVLIKTPHGEYEYETRIIMGKEIWISRARPHKLYDKIQKKAKIVNDKLNALGTELEIVAVDLGENITPEILGVEKVTGRVKGWTYTRYELGTEASKTKRIREIVDTEMASIKVMTMAQNAVKTTVEVFSNIEKSIIIVTSIIKVGTNLLERREAFERRFNNRGYYLNFLVKSKVDIVKYFRKLYPIKIDINIRNPPTALVDRTQLRLEDQEVLYFSIRDDDIQPTFGGEENKDKFVFGDIWDEDMIEKGNIPLEKNKRRYKPIRTGVNKQNFLVHGSNSDLPIEDTALELHDIIIS